MLEDPKKAPPTEITKTPVEGGVAQHPEGLKPWEDRSLSPEERKDAYADLVHEKLQEIASAFDRAGEVKDVAKQKEIMNSRETKKWMPEGKWVQAATAEEFCERMDRPRILGELLGKNFLGAEAWQAQGLDVGEAPPIPGAITEALLKSNCLLHPGEKIQDTHLLVLIPKTVNGEAYTALKLDELCVDRKGSGDKLIYGGASSWKEQDWAKAPQSQSEWVLIPKRDPDREKVPNDRHFRGKKIAEQAEVHKHYAEGYREAKALEVMTAALVNDVVNGEPRMLAPEGGNWNYLRCIEPNASRGRVLVGYFNALGLRVQLVVGDTDNAHVGRALARKS